MLKRFLNIRQLVFAALLTAGILMLSVTSANAINPCVPRPGCSCQYFQAAENRAATIRVRDKAYMRQIMKQGDNTLGMNCFDKVLILSSKQGMIFSDTFPGAAFPPANLQAWDPSNAVNRQVYDPTAGVGTNPRTNKSKVLGSQFELVFNEEAKSHTKASNFGDTLSAWLGATLFNFLSGYLAGLAAIFASMTTELNNLNTRFNDLFNDIQTILNWIDILGGAIPSVVATTVPLITAAWNTIYTTLIGLINSIQGLIFGFVDDIFNVLRGAIGSLLQFAATPDQDPCARIKRLWNPTSISGETLFAAVGAAGFRPMEGGGIERGAPYFDINTLLNFTGTMNDPLGAAISLAAALDLSDEIRNAANNPLLAAALTDLGVGGLLNTRRAPAAGVIWPTIPAVAQDATPFTLPPEVDAVIGTLGDWPPTGGTLQAIINAM